MYVGLHITLIFYIRSVPPAANAEMCVARRDAKRFAEQRATAPLRKRSLSLVRPPRPVASAAACTRNNNNDNDSDNRIEFTARNRRRAFERRRDAESERVQRERCELRGTMPREGKKERRGGGRRGAGVKQ